MKQAFIIATIFIQSSQAAFLPPIQTASTFIISSGKARNTPNFNLLIYLNTTNLKLDHKMGAGQAIMQMDRISMAQPLNPEEYLLINFLRNIEEISSNESKEQALTLMARLIKEGIDETIKAGRIKGFNLDLWADVQMHLVELAEKYDTPKINESSTLIGSSIDTLLENHQKGTILDEWELEKARNVLRNISIIETGDSYTINLSKVPIEERAGVTKYIIENNSGGYSGFGLIIKINGQQQSQFGRIVRQLVKPPYLVVEHKAP